MASWTVTVHDLEQVNASHDKFYRTFSVGPWCVFHWGRRGTTGQTKCLRSCDAASVAEEQVWAKRRGGYDLKGVERFLLEVDDGVAAGPLSKAVRDAYDEHVLTTWAPRLARLNQLLDGTHSSAVAALRQLRSEMKAHQWAAEAVAALPQVVTGPADTAIVCASEAAVDWLSQHWRGGFCLLGPTAGSDTAATYETALSLWDQGPLPELAEALRMARMVLDS